MCFPAKPTLTAGDVVELNEKILSVGLHFTFLKPANKAVLFEFLFDKKPSQPLIMFPRN